ncbi:hypothetical protein H4R33_007164 [Dimargaris cristalligena]|nr:hypothetical protein H4R33_007164 [Dimargaris cristalligena]
MYQSAPILSTQMPSGSTSYPNHQTNDYSNLVFGTPSIAAQPNVKLNESWRKNPLGLVVSTGFTKDKRETPPNDDTNKLARKGSFWLETPTPLREKSDPGGFLPSDVNDAAPSNAEHNPLKKGQSTIASTQVPTNRRTDTLPAGKFVEGDGEDDTEDNTIFYDTEPGFKGDPDVLSVKQVSAAPTV